MFRSISESMGKPVPIGTCGLFIEDKHPVFNSFPTQAYSTPQWYDTVSQSRPMILDDYKIEPLVWMIDNFERNHKLGLLFEIKVGTGKLFISACDFGKMDDNCYTKWLESSIVHYMESDNFIPKAKIELDDLYSLFGQK